MTGRLASLVLMAVAAHAQILAPASLRCEYLESGAFIDTPKPRFFFQPRHETANERQTAYQLQVALSPGFERILWDTGKMASADSIQIEYDGTALASDTTYYWRVRYWDSRDAVSPWSEVARFETALVRSDWHASWIGSDGLLRREFRLDSAPVRARAYVAGLGWSELRINGVRARDAVLDPGWTNYRKRVLYTADDVTPLLRKGANTIEVTLGRGRFGSLAMLFELRVTTESGQRYTIVSDGGWQSSAGPVTADDVYEGESYDARIEPSNWKPARVIDGPSGALSLQSMPPVRVLETLSPRSLESPAPGIHVVDFGRNLSGWVRLRVSGPRGARVRLRYAELLYPNGTVNRETLRRAKAEDTYTLRGGAVEWFEPRFTYHGFRYVEISGYPGTPSIEDIHARSVGSDLAIAGRFSSSNSQLNQLQTALVRTLRSNLMSIPTDNNQRDERLGWLADAHVAFDVTSANFDTAAFYSNFLRMIADEQDDSGGLPNTVPFVDFPGARESYDPAWASAYPLLAWHVYSEYADRRVLEQHYSGIVRLLRHIASKPLEGRYGDWVALDPTPPAMIAAFYYVVDLDIAARIAEILGRGEDAERWRRDHAQARAEFQSRFSTADTQTARILRLKLGLETSAQALAEQIILRNDSHLTTGIIGTRFALEALGENNRADLSYDLLNQRTYPSWGFMLASGATTLWELWQFRQGSRMNSHNQPMLGGALVWMYSGLAGIRSAAPGYRRITIQPRPAGDLEYVSASRETIAGPIDVAWRRSRTENKFRLDLRLPVGVTAEVVLPDNSRREAGSGQHTFELDWTQ